MRLRLISTLKQSMLRLAYANHTGLLEPLLQRYMKDTEDVDEEQADLGLHCLVRSCL